MNSDTNTASEVTAPVEETGEVDVVEVVRGPDYESWPVRGLWLLFVATALAVVGYGFSKGDLNNGEANTVIAANRTLLEGGASIQQPTIADDAASSAGPVSTGHATVLAYVGKLLGKPLEPQSARLCSLATVLAMLGCLYVGIYRSVGKWGARVVVLVTACSAPALIISGQATADALFAFAVVAATWAFFPKRSESDKRRLLSDLARYALAFALIELAVLLVQGVDLAGWATAPQDRILSPVYTLLVALPWVIGLAPMLHRDFWDESAKRFESSLTIAVALLVAGLVLGYQMPALWMGCGLIVAIALAIPVAICWQRWLAGDLAESCRDLQEASCRTLALGIPAVAVVVAVIRIGVTFNFMERVQAIVVVGLAAMAIAVWVIRWRQPRLYWVPILAVAVTIKIVYAHAYLPERDHWHSPKPYAHAVGRHLPEGSTLYTDQEMVPAYRYYLGAATAPLSALARSNDPAAPRTALFGEAEFFEAMSRNTGRWKAIRIFEGPKGNMLYLAREQPSEGVDRSAQTPKLEPLR